MLPTDVVRSLFEQLHLLNRTHNSDDMEEAISRIQRWIARNGFRGETRVIEFDADSVHNFWRIPRRWVVRGFSLKDTRGRDVIDPGIHPLVLVPFSNSFTGRVTRSDLLGHVMTRDDLPDAIPFGFRKMYRHWETGWQIALPKTVVNRLTDEHYDVQIETDFVNRPMKMLEYTVRGRNPEVVHFAAHLDHPGQCNDSLSGVIGSLCAVHEIESRRSETRYTYSVLMCPEIVGSAVYLHREPELARLMRYCLCPNMLGHDAPLAFCRSKSGRSALDKALSLALLTRGSEHVVGLWHKYPDCGDEISYDAPGLNIPTSTLSRVGELFRFYHTSLDTPDRIQPARFEEAVAIMADACEILEENLFPARTFVGNPSLANPDLGLYLEPSNVSNRLNPLADTSVRNLETGEMVDLRNFQEFFLSNLDGAVSLLDLADHAKVPFGFVLDYAARFHAKGLLNLNDTPRDGTRAGLVNVSLTRSGMLELT